MLKEIEENNFHLIYHFQIQELNYQEAEKLNKKPNSNLLKKFKGQEEILKKLIKDEKNLDQ